MHQLDIQCRPSIQHFSALIVAHALALLGLVASGQPVEFQLAMALIVLISLVHFGRLALLCHPLAIRRVKAEQLVWRLSLVNGEERTVRRTGEVVVWPWLVVARFKDRDGTYPLVLMPDTVSRFDHRRSRIYFRYYSI